MTMFRRSILTVLLTLLLAAPGRESIASDKPEYAQTQNAYDFEFTSIDGDPLPLSNFAGKVILVVNTASLCGFTRQYEGLVDLWQKYQGHGLIVLGIPSNDFGNQEPGTAGEIKDFCEITYGVDFPMTEKVSVKGANAHPFYRWAAARLGPDAKPRWNFHKYIVGADGQLADWFSSATGPASKSVVKSIESQLGLAGKPSY